MKGCAKTTRGLQECEISADFCQVAAWCARDHKTVLRAKARAIGLAALEKITGFLRFQQDSRAHDLVSSRSHESTVVAGEFDGGSFLAANAAGDTRVCVRPRFRAASVPGGRVLLSALVAPVVLAAFILVLNWLVDPGSDAPLTAIALWVTLYLPFYAFMPRRTDSLIPLLTVVQWAIIAGFTAWFTRGWRIYEAVAIAFATILTTGVAIVIGLLLMGYRFQLTSS